MKDPYNYIGTDDTEVGIYGGVSPWNPVPSNPQIHSSKVDATTSNNRELRIQVEVEVQQ